MFGSKKNNKKTRNTKKNNTTVNNNRNNSNNRNYGNTYGRSTGSQYGAGNRYSSVGRYRVSENVFSTGAGMNNSRSTYGSGRSNNSSHMNNTRNQRNYGYTSSSRNVFDNQEHNYTKNTGTKQHKKTAPKPKRTRKYIPTINLSSRNSKAIPIYIFIFALVLIQVIGYSASRVTKGKVSYDTVQYGTIDSPNVIQGVIVRDEKVYNTTVDGVISYDVADGEKVKPNTEVCSIKDQAAVASMESDLEKIDNDIMDVQDKRDDISIYSDDINKDNQQIKKIVDDSAINFATLNLEDVYELKTNIEKELSERNQLLLSENQGALTDLVTKRKAQEEKLNQSISKVSTNESGIVSYDVIGDEDKYTLETMKSLTKKNTLATTSSDSGFKTSVKANSPVFKIIKSNTWYIAAYISEDYTKDWKTGNVVNIYAKDDNGVSYTLPATINTLSTVKDGKEKYVILSITKNMLEFVGDRSISFEPQKTKKGYKVPNSSIVDETLLQIPSDYITENNTVNKVSGSNTKEIQVVVSSVDKEKKISYVPVQLGILNVGDEIQKPNSSSKYKIENVVNSNGIYVVNSGIAEFKIVSLDDSVANSTHTILDIGKNPNINIYDRIMTDTENVTKEEKVFE